VIPSARNVLLTGLHRSGTTLVCHLLNQLPDTVALHEPMDVAPWTHAVPKAQIFLEIDTFCAQNRESLLKNGTALTKHVEGTVPDNSISDRVSDGGLRQPMEQRGMVSFDKPFSNKLLLVLKHPAAFSALLGDLFPRYECYAVIRNPLSVLASWCTVNIPANRGRLPAGEALDPTLKQQLDQTEDVRIRQLIVLNWYFKQFSANLHTERILRYENIVASQGRVLESITPDAQKLNAPLESKNANKLYSPALMMELSEYLIQNEGDWRNFYSEDDVLALVPR